MLDNTPAPAGLPAKPCEDRMFVGGARVAVEDGGTVERPLPAQGVVVSPFRRGTDADADRAVVAACTVFEEDRWPDLRGAARIIACVAGRARALNGDTAHDPVAVMPGQATRAPTGGFRRSGSGRAMGMHRVTEYTGFKATHVELAGRVRRMTD